METMSEEVAPLQKALLSVDVGLCNIGLCVICPNTKNVFKLYNQSIKPEGKLKMAPYYTEIINKARDMIKSILQQYDIHTALIEQQIGKYAAIQMQVLFHTILLHERPEIRIEIISPLHKLKIKYCKDAVDQLDKTTKKYNQNKNESVLHATAFLEQTQQLADHNLSRDQSDALLQALWYIQYGDKR